MEYIILRSKNRQSLWFYMNNIKLKIINMAEEAPKKYTEDEL